MSKRMKKMFPIVDVPEGLENGCVGAVSPEMSEQPSEAGATGQWDLTDELKLLDAINNCGYGNWQSISLKVPPYSPSECEKHYNERFVCDVPRSAALCPNNCKIEIEPLSETRLNFTEIWQMNEFLRNMAKTEPDYKYTGQSFSGNTVKSSNQSNKFFNYMTALPNIGYNRVRSDFDVEYDNNAENILKLIRENQFDNFDLDEEEFRLFQETVFVLYQSYNERLKQRHFRKKIVRNHCLLDRRKTYNMLQRLDVSFGSTRLKVLIPFMRFFSGPEFDLFVERLKYQNDLKLKIALLIEYRNKGLKFLRDIDIYKKLNNKRFKYNEELARINMSSSDSKSGGNFSKKPSAPLILAHLPGYNRLNEDEKTLCSTSRIVPEAYLTFKEALITECEKYNGLRLAQARNLIKIDVNKTRKIYDYLLSLDMIWPPDS